MAYLAHLEASLRMVTRRAATNLLGVGALSLLGVASVGCGHPAATIACSTKDDCIMRVQASGKLDDGGAFSSTNFQAYDAGPITIGATFDCVASVCVVQTSGCDSGYRYITAEPEFGACTNGPALDLAVTTDLMPLDASGSIVTPDMMETGDGG